jgi:hypothetical protein
MASSVEQEEIIVHDHRFDAMVRAIPTRVSRRGALRGFIAAFAAVLAVMRGTETAAHHTMTPLGGPCHHTNQCLHHGVAMRRGRTRSSRHAVYCADNGFRYDGALNCCRYGGGSCRLDEHCCCSRHFCRNKVCTYLA